jgi:hypothetical protein
VRAIERTTRQFVASLEAAIPGLHVSIERSVTPYGRSNYIHIRDQAQRRYWKVRISDHPIGMRRALSGREDLYITAGTRPPSWAVWIGEFRRLVDNAIPSP